MQEQLILSFLKDVNNYKKPNYPIVQGIIHSTQNANDIVKEISELLREDYLRTQDILGDKITTLVMNIKIETPQII